MSRTFLQLAHTGDLINSLPILRAEFEATGEPAKIMCCNQYAPLFGGTSYVQSIAFDGTHAELRRAHAEASAGGQEVVSLQVIGNTNDVRDITYGPAGMTRAVTDSFQKEPYWITKNQALWAKQARPLFDGRSKKREKALGAELVDAKEGTIFVAADGRSSPFPYKSILLELLKGRFGGEYFVVDLADFKAERFYDFLGLLEGAHCLVAVDSAFLHLAHACPELPVCALTNDSPGLWFGSSWRANHISYVRYSDFPYRAVEMLDAIEGIGQPGSYFYPTLRDTPTLLHVWSAYECSEESNGRHRAAKESWETAYRSKGPACWVSCPATVGAFGRDSKHHPQINDDLRFPFLKDVLRVPCYRGRDEDIIVLTRHDTVFNDGLAENILSGPLPAYCHRSYRDEDSTHLTWHPTVDLFAFTKAWWREHQSKLPEFFLATDQHWSRTLLASLLLAGAREIPCGVFRAPSKATVKGGKRSQYQERLAREFQDANGEFSLVKPALEQLPSVVVNRHALPAFAYNPTIIRWQNRLLMCCRWHNQSDYSTALSIAEIDEQGNVLRVKPLQLPHVGGSEEDARFFVFRNELHLCFVDSTYPTMPPKAVVKYGKLIEDTTWSIGEIHQPLCGKNDMTACEKNWVMWEHDGKLLCRYSLSPRTLIYELQGSAAMPVAEAESPRWSFGPMRGGTVPIPHNGFLLHFFHSALDYELPPDRRRYFIGAMLTEPTPPFKAVAISKRPILWGAENDLLSQTERSGCWHYKSKVVFPLGAIDLTGGKFLLSVGINDCQCALFTVTENDMNL